MTSTVDPVRNRDVDNQRNERGYRLRNLGMRGREVSRLPGSEFNGLVFSAKSCRLTKAIGSRPFPESNYR
jgi:hypothetical protein